MKNKTIKTVLIDDDSRALNRLKILLTHFKEVEVVAQFDNAEQGLAYILKTEPDLVLLDIEMPQKTGIEIAETLNKQAIDTKIIFTSAYEHYAIKAIKTAAFDYLLKPISIDELKKTVQRFTTKFQIDLSQRELQIIRELANGLNSKAIGEKLFISRHTVDTYRRKILEKTGCHNSSELIKFASVRGMV